MISFVKNIQSREQTGKLITEKFQKVTIKRQDKNYKTDVRL